MTIDHYNLNTAGKQAYWKTPQTPIAWIKSDDGRKTDVMTKQIDLIFFFQMETAWKTTRQPTIADFLVIQFI